MNDRVTLRQGLREFVEGENSLPFMVAALGMPDSAVDTFVATVMGKWATVMVGDTVWSFEDTCTGLAACMDTMGMAACVNVPVPQLARWFNQGVLGDVPLGVAATCVYVHTGRAKTYPAVARVLGAEGLRRLTIRARDVLTSFGTGAPDQKFKHQYALWRSRRHSLLVAVARTTCRLGAYRAAWTLTDVVRIQTRLRITFPAVLVVHVLCVGWTGQALCPVFDPRLAYGPQGLKPDSEAPQLLRLSDDDNGRQWYLAVDPTVHGSLFIRETRNGGETKAFPTTFCERLVTPLG